MRNTFVLSLLATILVFASCQKKTEDKEPTKTDLLVKSSWKFQKAEATGIGDVSTSIDDCLKDNTAIFVSDGSGTIDEGATKCDSGDPQTKPFTWSFLDNETKLSVSGGLFAGQSGDFTIVTLNETSLVLSGTMPIDVAGTTVNVQVQASFIH